ncbi:S8 family serine peptidase [Tabrizicola aquatica]|uniref:S8 family serine peptidase n=1 Tax=Tabrizicola aquatica TaxID=909926 RepID=UPI000CD26D4A|nr:S8 family serine peptidase [Tabrizicola aquatica]
MPDKLLLRSVATMLCLALATAPVVWQADPAWAQDDDDDDGGDDDDDGGDDDDDDGGGSSSGSNDDDDDDGGSQGGSNDDDDDDDSGRASPDDDRPSRTTGQQPRRPPPAPAPRELARFAAGEVVTLELTEADLATLLDRGFRVLEERPVPEIGIVARRLAIPDDSTLEEARDQVRALASGGDADFNHYYRTEQAPTAEPVACQGQHCPSLEQIGWTAPALPATCAADVLIGVIDTGINPDHAAFAAARLDVHRLAPESLDPSRAVHGTAVLSLLIGSPDSRSPGLLPDAQVVAVDAFHTASGDERADVYTLAAGMDFLADRGVRVINMSLAGPPNSVLEAATAALVARGVIIVAAVGNGGPKADPSYPAAYPGVIAVTAVDSADTVYRRAGRGPHVDLAAPGVDVWTAASVSGARPKTGTSFAAPFVTAAAASALVLRPELDATTLAAELAASAKDLGDPGRDDVYGFGLIQAQRLCQP